MAQITVDAIESAMAAYLDQDENTSNISSTDYSLRLKYINMSLNEWENSYDWQVLYKEYNMLVSAATGNASIILPTNFKKLASFPVISTGGSTNLYADTRPQEAGQYSDFDKRVEILGNPQDRYYMRVYGVTLASGASVRVPYYASAQSLATSSSIAEIPNPDYLVKRSIAYLLEVREDARFPQMKQEAERILATMIDLENVFGEGSTFDRVRSVDETRYKMRWGED